MRPPFADLLLAAHKTIEVRRRFPSDLAPRQMFIYASSPARALLGTVQLEAVTACATEEIWDRHADVIGIEQSALLRYLHGVHTAALLHVTTAVLWPHPVPLTELRARYRIQPPQSWRYLDHAAADALHLHGYPNTYPADLGHKSPLAGRETATASAGT